MSKIERVSTDVSYGFGAVNDLLGLAITEGLVTFTTDSNQIYVDMEGKRYCYDSIIMVATEREMMGLTTFAEGKLYFAEDTKCLYMNENNKWNKVFETTEGIISSLPTYLSLSFVDVLPAQGSEKNIYLMDSSEYEGVEKQLWLYNETAGSYFRIVPTEAEIITIIDNQFKILEEDLQVRYITLKAALGGQTSEEPDIAQTLAELLENYPLKSTVYTKEETNQQISAATTSINSTIANVQADYQKSKYITGEFTERNGAITLSNNIKVYKASSTAIISFDITSLPSFSNRYIEFELIITGCKNVTPVINENVKWLENIAPDYTTFDNVLITFKSIDNGNTWLGLYNGGWNA